MNKAGTVSTNTQRQPSPSSPMMKKDEISAAAGLLRLPNQSTGKATVEKADKNENTKKVTFAKRRPRALKKTHFPSALYEIVSDKANQDIVHWVHGGKAFVIIDKVRFASEILPRYFKQSQFTSFTRKLTRWGFNRIARGQSIGSYYHKMFLRHAPHLCRLMNCCSDPKELKKLRSSLSNSPPPAVPSPTIDLTSPSPVATPVNGTSRMSLANVKSITQQDVTNQILQLRRERLSRMLQIQKLSLLREQQVQARQEIALLLKAREDAIIQKALRQQQPMAMLSPELLSNALALEQRRLLNASTVASRQTMAPQQSLQSRSALPTPDDCKRSVYRRASAA